MLVAGLPAADQMRLRELLGHRKHLRPREDLVRQGDMPECAHFLLDGILARYKLLPGGRRAVVAYLLPGDFCGPHPDFHQRMDHGISALTPATVAEVSHHLLQEQLRADPALARHFIEIVMTGAAIQRQWLANMACPSDKRAAHLLCELRHRLARVGQADERSFLLPLTQHELSEALGISTVHVNRVLQHLKDLGLARIMDRRVMIGDLTALERFAEFDPAYLGGERRLPEEQRFSAAS
jgi:CRP-like cAMP-binding protein